MLDNRVGSGIKEYAYKAVVCLFVIFMFYKCGMLIKDDVPRFRAEYLLTQQDYNRYDVEQKTMGKEVIYYPKEGDRTGYDPFPSTPNPERFIMSGDYFKDGFLPVNR